MPRKVRLPADTAQNRENQQRSRARRREYVASLEARVREFESREVQATLAMQRAAQEVAWVNERLMELLAAKGVARDEVDEFLRQAGKDEARMYVSDGSQARGASPRAGDPSVCRGVKNGKDDTHGRNIADTSVDMNSPRFAVDEHRMNVSFQTPQPSVDNTDEAPSAHVTSCDNAASIIADFQGHGDVSHARKVLGCGDAAKCHVKNTRLFQLMDEA